jgi:hypothetical protein
MSFWKCTFCFEENETTRSLIQSCDNCQKALLSIDDLFDNSGNNNNDDENSLVNVCNNLGTKHDNCNNYYESDDDDDDDDDHEDPIIEEMK